MSRSFPELDVFRVTVSEPTRASHLAAITKALQKPARRYRRRRLLAVALAAVLLFPVVALAAERSLPGDFLYPLKRNIVEPVVALFDEDVVAVHRVEEVEELLLRDGPIDLLTDHVAEAQDAAADSPDLIDRIDRVVDEAERLHQDFPRHDRPATTIEEQEEDRQSETESVPTTTVVSDGDTTGTSHSRPGEDSARDG